MISEQTVSTTLDEASIRERLRARPPALLLVPFLTLLCLGVLTLAWMERGQNYVSADRGLGYALGVAGLTAMLLLLLYPLRKRSARMQRWGPIRVWFHAHMALGIVGPTLVLLHSNFELGSTNSSVALFSALLVAGSGYVGRFAYARIHYRFSGQRTRHGEVAADVRSLREALVERDPRLEADFRSLEDWAHGVDRGAFRLLGGFLGARRRIRTLRRAVERRIDLQRDPGARLRIDAYLVATRRLARFRTYERVFALWHAVHLPLSFFLYGAAAVHVVAVHLF